MNKQIVIFISIILYVHQTQCMSRITIPTATSSKATQAATKASEKILGPKKTQKLMEHSKTGKDWWNWYWSSFSRPTTQELKMHGLWYGLKSGNLKSRGENPLHEYYQNLQNYWQEKMSNAHTDNYPDKVMPWIKKLSVQDLNQHKDTIKNYHAAYQKYHLASDQESKNDAQEELLEREKELNDLMHKQDLQAAESKARKKELRESMYHPSRFTDR